GKERAVSAANDVRLPRFRPLTLTLCLAAAALTATADPALAQEEGAERNPVTREGPALSERDLPFSLKLALEYRYDDNILLLNPRDIRRFEDNPRSTTF